MQFAHAEFIAPPPLSLSYEQCFLYRRNIRKAWAKGEDLGAVPIPPPPN